MQLTLHPSPNQDERPEGANIDVIVMHYTGMQSHQAALEQLCSKTAKVSAHYLIDESGDVVQLVPEKKRAWHAGISCWRGRAALNDTSIGIELTNPGHEFGYRPFPDAQMETLTELSKAIMARHHIEARNIIGHSDIAPNRKTDPGELFNWRQLAACGIGIWPEVDKIENAATIIASKGDESSKIAFIQKGLNTYGYHILVDGFFGPKMESVIKAFKNHFVQDDPTLFWTNRDQATLDALLKMVVSS